jgi:hypothetical protein
VITQDQPSTTLDDSSSTSPRSSTAVNQRVPSQPAVPHSGRGALNCAQACCRLGGVDLPSEQVRRSEEHRLPHARLATCSCAALRKATTPASACCSCQPRSPGGDVVPCCLPMAVPPRRRQLAQPPCGPSTSTSARGPPRTRPPGAPGSPLPGYPRRPAALRQGQGPPTGSAARAHPYPGFGPAHTRPGLP